MPRTVDGHSIMLLSASHIPRRFSFSFASFFIYFNSSEARRKRWPVIPVIDPTALDLSGAHGVSFSFVLLLQLEF